jgi:hypothetical protein
VRHRIVRVTTEEPEEILFTEITVPAPEATAAASVRP